MKTAVKENSVIEKIKYNQKDDDKMCQCGDTYYRHFDPQDNMKFVGCKFCGCKEFVEKV